MASVEALAIQREHFEREQNERLERIEAKQDEILQLLRKAGAKASPAKSGDEAKPADSDKPADETDKKPAGK